MKDLNNQFSGLTYRNRIRFDPEILKAEVKRAPSTPAVLNAAESRLHRGTGQEVR
jgi:hypothetical protein